MKRGYAKIYFIVLILLVSFSFFFNFNGLEDITGRAVHDPCVVPYYGDEIGEVLFILLDNKVTLWDVIEFPPEVIPIIGYDGTRNSNGVYDFKNRNGKSVTATIDDSVLDDCVREERDDKAGTRSQVSQGDSCRVHSPDDCPLEKCKVVEEEQTQSSKGCGGITPITVQRCVEKTICRLEDNVINPVIITFNRGEDEFTGTIYVGNPTSVITSDAVILASTHPLDTPNPGCGFYSFEKEISERSFVGQYAGVTRGDFCQYFNPNGQGGCSLEVPGAYGGNCPQTHTCVVSEGHVNTYAFYITGDKCGNKIITPENEGRPVDSFDNLPVRLLVETACTDLYNLEGEAVEEETENLCGNGKIDEGEDCDGNNLNGKSCKAINPKFTGGNLKCNSECKFDTRECKRDISGEVSMDIDLDILDENNKIVKDEVKGKILLSLRLKDASEKDGPTTTIYKLGVQGNVAFSGAYSKTMQEIASDPKKQNLWNLLNRVKGTGIHGTGIVKELKSDGLTINKVFSTDLSIYTLLKKEGDDDWKNSEITIEIKRKESGSDVEVKQQIWNVAKGKLLSNKRTVVQLNKRETDDLVKELLERFASYNSIRKGSSRVEKKLPVEDSDDEIEKIKKGKYKAGVKLKILHKFILFVINSDIYIDKVITYEKIDVAEIYEFLKILYPDESTRIDDLYEAEIALALSDISIVV